ncbi:outer membrane beta-barrel family protein [Patiriisocius hiemis]|uniref:Outer membrane beta-barrel family protein n=1 Tax=Patiriisocius hiemis TaxID=3075604 RepID=A0ABU2YCX4_9FLAO|nr:outer membrane beta-barrel family protein [Constantimarinum sp. W242]MDT0555617.1 outer membrane beta-barrel family protein [Constantimarinum sp. W242]
MKRKCFLTLTFIVIVTVTFGQNFSVSGSIKDGKNPIYFATILLYEADNDTPLKGTSSNEDGSFIIDDVPANTYKLIISYVGFKNFEQTFTLSENKNLGVINLLETIVDLEETVVTAKNPTIEKTAGKLIFNVENTSLSTGSTFDLLKRTPGVLVIGNEIKVKLGNPTIYINNKRVYLSSSEVVSLLQNTDASIIKSVEVNTNPSAKYDAEAGTVLNIITSKAISVGYKGSVSGTYEQAVFAKYNATTSHFYKNNWLNFYGSYGISPRKEFKQDDNFIRFFNQNGTSTQSIWESDFTRTTRSQAHQINLAADITLNEKNELSLTANGLISPNKTFVNTVDATIFDAARQIDSTFSTLSDLENDTSNLSLSASHQATIGEKGANVITTANYITYDYDQIQNVATTYFLPDGMVSRNNSFFTNATQNTNIFSGQLDVTTPFGKGTLETGLKYSNIDTESGLDFFDTDMGANQFNNMLSDLFLYEEVIYAGYFNYAKDWEKLGVHLGLRGEYTDVTGDSRSQGVVNTQEYFELFPNVGVDYFINSNNILSISYARSITRPRYQSLNPFRYFINENNFNTGNPNLIPAITNRYQVSLAHKRKWFFDVYYEIIDDELNTLVFQDNENFTLRNSEANLIEGFQYSFDATFASYLNNWWYLTVATSSFYLENSFFAEESSQDIFSNDTFGFFSQMFSRLTLSKEKNITSDVTLFYLSDFFIGSSDYENQFNLSVSFRKSFWNNRASLTVGVDDVFNTNNVEVNSHYFNQDNSYFARPESRLFRLGFQYNFGNARLRDNNRNIDASEKDRLN